MFVVTARENMTALTDLASRLGVEIRVEPFHVTLAGRGGLCRLDGRSVILVDERLTLIERVGVVALALGRLDLQSVPVPPSLLPLLRTGHAAIAPLAPLASRPARPSSAPRHRPRPLARGRLRLVS